MDKLSNSPPPSQLEKELHETIARLKNLEQQTKILQQLVAAGRKDADYDLFFRRIHMAENFSRLPPEAMPQLHTVDLYQDFWKLAGEAQHTTKFAADEKISHDGSSNKLSTNKIPFGDNILRWR